MKIQNHKIKTENTRPLRLNFSHLAKENVSKPTIKFKFEKFDLDPRNKHNSAPILFDRSLIGNFFMENQEGFRFSQVVESMVEYHKNTNDTRTGIIFEPMTSTTSGLYIIPTAVQYSPYDWTDMKIPGESDPNKKSIFELLTPVYLSDLQHERALLLIDQSVEGYSAPWLWKWFYEKCQRYNIKPSSIIYLTGDQSCNSSYDEWCIYNNINCRLKVLSSTSLGMYVYKHFQRYIKGTDFHTILQHKKHNQDSMYLYDCINMRPRLHRIYMFLHLIHAGIDNLGNISMPEITEWKDYVNLSSIDKFIHYNVPQYILDNLDNIQTPRIANYFYNRPTKHYYSYVERILDDLYRNSWVSLINESSYFDYEHNVFISEKTLKPIACMQPFIILGSRHTLKYLRNLGYKTFHPFIDESYDDLPDTQRFIGIVNSLKKIHAIEDKVTWMESIQDILEHNYKKFLEIGIKKFPEHIAIENYYFEKLEASYVRNTL